VHKNEFDILVISQDNNKVITVTMLVSKVSSSKPSKNSEYFF